MKKTNKEKSTTAGRKLSVVDIEKKQFTPKNGYSPSDTAMEKMTSESTTSEQSTSTTDQYTHPCPHVKYTRSQMSTSMAFLILG